MRVTHAFLLFYILRSPSFCYFYYLFNTLFYRHIIKLMFLCCFLLCAGCRVSVSPYHFANKVFKQFLILISQKTIAYQKNDRNLILMVVHQKFCRKFKKYIEFLNFFGFTTWKNKNWILIHFRLLIALLSQ